MRSATAAILLLPAVLASPAASAEDAAPLSERYRTSWRDPALIARVDKGIERNRKGDAAVAVVDAGGGPVAGAQVTIRQTKHAFLFGCNAFVLGQLTSDEINRRYEECFVKLFNQATIPFYWEGTEPAQGELRYDAQARDIWRRPEPTRFLPFAARHDLVLKAHPLLWHGCNPTWLPKDPEVLRGLYVKRFNELASRFGAQIPIWEVVNESQVCPKGYGLYTPGKEYVAWAFAEAAKIFPADRHFMINEVTDFNFKPADGNPYFAQVKNLLAQKLKIDGIGLQYHFFRRKNLDGWMGGKQCDAGALLDLYERFAAFGLPLYITEITIPSAGDGGEALQAEVVRDHYRLWFSAPTMAGITWWNLGDSHAYKGENEAMGGLMGPDLQPKAAYRVLDDLINKEWRTSAAMTTDAAGAVRFRGFHGTYTVTVRKGDRETAKTFTLKKGEPAAWTVTF